VGERNTGVDAGIHMADATVSHDIGEPTPSGPRRLMARRPQRVEQLSVRSKQRAGYRWARFDLQ